MAKTTTWQCANCKTKFPKWAGKCSSYDEWGTVVEVDISQQLSVGTPATSVRMAKATTGAKPTPVSQIVAMKTQNRLKTNITEFDRVLGGGLATGAVILLAASPGAGKALALDTPLVTPTGWTTMGEVSVGDQLIGMDGKPTNVVAVTDVQHDRPVYRVEFSDGSSIVADEQHEWLVSKHQNETINFIIKTTKDIVNYSVSREEMSFSSTISYGLPKVGVTESTTEIPTGNRYITNVTPIDSVPVKCVQVDNEDHMYLAGKTMIPTHNSTILGMVAQSVAVQDKKVLYISGEENESQIASRHTRIGATDDSILILSESNLNNATQAIHDEMPDLIIVDSIQTMVSGSSEGKVGSPSQAVEVANDFTSLAKRLNIPTILIGHITKDGNVAGPKTVEHLVDVVLYMEASPDTSLRLLRGIKNRYGATDEIGCFEHTETGLIEITDPSGFFTNPHDHDVTGYATSILIEGQRALPVEVQALVTPSPLPNPRKISHGLDHARCLMIQAILEKYAGLKLNDKDVYVSTTGGLTVKDSSIDLAVAAAIMSSYKDLPPADNSAFIGELSLTGELRKARFADKRKREANRLGFTNVFDDQRVSSIHELLAIFSRQ